MKMFDLAAKRKVIEDGEKVLSKGNGSLIAAKPKFKKFCRKEN